MSPSTIIIYSRLNQGANWIIISDRIVLAICEHIASQSALAGGSVNVAIQEAMSYRVVIAGIEVVITRFGVVEITAIADGVPPRQVLPRPGDGLLLTHWSFPQVFGFCQS